MNDLIELFESKIDRRLAYRTSCVDATAEAIDAMTSAAREITYRTMLKHCDLISWAVEMGYARRKDRGLTLRNDWHVSYYKSRYDDTRCYYLVHSHIEHIWVGGDGRADMAELGGDWIRRRLREESFKRAVSVPGPPGRPDHGPLVKMVQIDPSSRSMVLTFRGDPSLPILAPRPHIPFVPIGVEEEDDDQAL